MVGVGYGKGAKVDEKAVRWLSPDEVEGRAGLCLVDARDAQEHAAASIPGALSLAQTDLMFKREAKQQLIDELLAGERMAVSHAKESVRQQGGRLMSARRVSDVLLLLLSQRREG